MDPLDTSWQRVWLGLGARGDEHAARADLISRWSEPQRHYHTPQHLRECLATLGGVIALAQRAAEVEAALWFHDAVYNLRESGNEEKSAELASRVLGAAGVDAAAIERIAAMVLATKHDAADVRRRAVPGADQLPPGAAGEASVGAPFTPDEQIVVDVDLAILGAAPARFDEYDRQVVDEYAFVPQSIFRRKRREILASLAARPRLYATAHFHALLDAQARANLARAIERYTDRQAD
jgi:predicted metal-dependent HD superfamily phosphohydrolase